MMQSDPLINKKKSPESKTPRSWEYKKNAIYSANPLQLIMMLYEEAILCLEESKEYIGDFKTYDTFNKKIHKTIDIVSELRLSLDMSQGEIPTNLERIYEYINRILVEANIKKDSQPIDEAIKILNDLLSSWKEVEKKKIDMSNSVSSRREGGFSITG